jgi:hypothetical protein
VLPACGGDGTATIDDLAVAPDLVQPGVWLGLPDGTSKSLTAFYSILVEPLENGVPQDPELVVTLIDPAFDCSGAAVANLDAISFGFAARVAGVTSSGVFSRSGPHLGPLVGGGTGTAELSADDDRYLDLDGGAVLVAPGGMVAGDVHWSNGGVTVGGAFVAPHCALLDAAAAP